MTPVGRTLRTSDQERLRPLRADIQSEPQGIRWVRGRSPDCVSLFVHRRSASCTRFSQMPNPIRRLDRIGCLHIPERHPMPRRAPLLFASITVGMVIGLSAPLCAQGDEAKSSSLEAKTIDPNRVASPAISIYVDAQAANQAPPGVDPTAVSEADLISKLNPLRLEQLSVELEAWLQVVEKKETELAQAKIDARESGTPSEAAIEVLRVSRAALAKRAKLVLREFEAKSGDGKEARAYLNNLAGFELTGIQAVWQWVQRWFIREDGGLYWLFGLLKFVGTLVLFSILSRLVGRLVRRATSRLQHASSLLKDFFANVASKAVFLVGLVIALGFLGVEMGPFIAAIGAAGFIIGFALQGTLSNFAAGIMILLYRPFDIGNWVKVAGEAGTVDAMNLVSTTIVTGDNQSIVVPNGKIWGDVITNVNGRPTRRVDLKFGIAYDDDFGQAESIIREVIARHPMILDDPAPNIRVHELADSSCNLVVRPWTKTENYWDVYWDLTRQIKEAFDTAGISIPYPQRDLHVYRHDVEDSPSASPATTGD